MASFYYIEVLDHAISRVWLRFSTYHLLPRERKKPSEYFNFCICRWQELNLGILCSQRVCYHLHQRLWAITMFLVAVVAQVVVCRITDREDLSLNLHRELNFFSLRLLSFRTLLNH